MGLSSYKLDKGVIDDGVWFKYDGGLEIKLRYAGPSNKEWVKAVEKHTAPLRTKYRGRDVPKDELEPAFREAFAEAIVADWRGARWSEDDPDMECTTANVLEVINALPELWNEMSADANNRSAFRVADEGDLGNS